MVIFMALDSSPLRWPLAWKDSSMFGLLEAVGVKSLIVESAEVAAAARQAGFNVLSLQQLPSDVVVARGLWPGIRVSPAGGDHAAAGPTGEPWVDSNGWRIRVARVRRPGVEVLVDTKPNPSRISAEDYIVAFADAAAHGGRLIITLDDSLAAGMASKQAEAMERWKRIAAADAFFRRPTAVQQDLAVIGVLSGFAGPKVGFTDEVLNNLARTKQQYRPVFAGRPSLDALKAVIYTDAEEPSGALRKQVLEFVGNGGMLITGSGWGSIPKSEVVRTHFRYTVRGVGKGSIAVATGSFADPYLVANDAVVLVSHREDIVRFFNTGAITPCLSAKTGGVVLQTVFYSLRPVEDASVWVKGSYKSARLRAFGQTADQTVKLVTRDPGVEIYLPAVSQYARIELES